MRSLTRHTIAALCSVAASLAIGAPARANSFTVQSCAGQSDGYPWNSENSSWMHADCTSSDGLLLWADGANGPNLAYGSWARWRLTIPSSLQIVRLQGAIRLSQADGWYAGFEEEDRAQWLYGGPTCLGQCGNGVYTTFDFGADSHDVSFVMVCLNPSCHPTVRPAVTGLVATINDPTAPGLSLTGGSLVNGSWVHGDASVSYQATDDSGVRRVEVFVDGQQKATDEQRCTTLRIPACPPEVDDTTTLSTKLFSDDGAHVVTVRATDFSGNANDASFTVHADNTAPIAPLGLADDGAVWQATNRFGVHWTNPKQVDGAAPIAGATWRMCPVDTTGDCTTGHEDGSNLSEVDDLSVPGPGLWRVQLALVDAAGNADLANASEAMVGYDDTAPDLAIEPTNPQDPTRLEIDANDDRSPIAEGDVEVQRRGSNAWRAVPTQVTEKGLEAVVDDEALPAGDYAVRAHVSNAAGLERSTDDWTSGQAAMLTLPLRVPTKVRLGAARHKNGNPRAHAVLVRRPVIAYGKRVRLTGQLTAPGGNALAGVAVLVTSRIDMPGAADRAVAQLRTDHSGHFRYMVPPGPSRLISFRYPGTATIRPISQDVPVRVRASTTMKVSRHVVVNGDAVRFSGKIRGGHLPAGKRVELQFYARGKWRTFDSTHANRHARWGYTYRFDGSRGTVRWAFRALITPETGYPYTSGHSRRTNVTVHGLP